MKKHLLMLFAVLALVQGGACAETWIQVDKTLWVDESSIYDDPDGYTRYVTRELDEYGNVRFKHKEAVHCDNFSHHFRKMYDAGAYINNHDDSDVEWTDWRTNSREVYDDTRIDDLLWFMCGW